MKNLTVILSIFLLFLFGSVNLTAAQDRKAVSGAEVTGTFRSAGGNEFSILAIGKGKLRIAFSGVYEYDSAYGKMANTGEAEGEADIDGDTAVFTPEDFEECTITLKFLIGGKLKVSQEGTDADCGFGANVFADGVYKKISSKKPQFSVD